MFMIWLFHIMIQMNQNKVVKIDKEEDCKAGKYTQ